MSYGVSYVTAIPIVSSEILARTEPHLLDLGVAIAAGWAGAFSLTRASIANSIAGVAIAVALVPPLCVIGIGLEMGPSVVSDLTLSIGRDNLPFGAMLLFLANLAGITFSACLVFLLQSYGSLRPSLLGLLRWLMIILVLCWPLWDSLREFVATYEIEREMILLQRRAEGYELSRQWLLDKMEVELREDQLTIEMALLAQPGIVQQEIAEKLRDHLVKRLQRTKGIKHVKLKLFVAPIDIFVAERELAS